MDGGRDGWMEGWKDGWMDGWMDKRKRGISKKREKDKNVTPDRETCLAPGTGTGS